MSAPLSHIIFARKFLKKINIKNLNDFYIGVCFPDIRYLGVIDREKTHQKIKSFDDFSNCSDFELGIKCHVLVDMIRGNYIKNTNINSLIPDAKFASMALKFYEDQIHSKNTSSEDIIKYLNTFIQGECNFNIATEDIKKWHIIIQKYLDSKFDETSILDLTNNFISNQQIASEMKIILPEIENSSEIKQTLENFYNNFDSILDEYIIKHLNSSSNTD